MAEICLWRYQPFNVVTTATCHKPHRRHVHAQIDLNSATGNMRLRFADTDSLMVLHEAVTDLVSILRREVEQPYVRTNVYDVYDVDGLFESL